MSAVTYPMTQRHEWLRPAKQTLPRAQGPRHYNGDQRGGGTLYDQIGR